MQSLKHWRILPKDGRWIDAEMDAATSRRNTALLSQSLCQRVAILSTELRCWNFSDECSEIQFRSEIYIVDLVTHVNVLYGCGKITEPKN